MMVTSGFLTPLSTPFRIDSVTLNDIRWIEIESKWNYLKGLAGSIGFFVLGSALLHYGRFYTPYRLPFATLISAGLLYGCKKIYFTYEASAYKCRERANTLRIAFEHYELLTSQTPNELKQLICKELNITNAPEIPAIESNSEKHTTLKCLLAFHYTFENQFKEFVRLSNAATAKLMRNPRNNLLKFQATDYQLKSLQQKITDANYLAEIRSILFQKDFIKLEKVPLHHGSRLQKGGEIVNLSALELSLSIKKQPSVPVKSPHGES